MESPIIAKSRDLVKRYWYDLFLLGCIICIAVISYNLGRIHALQRGSSLKTTKTTNGAQLQGDTLQAAPSIQAPAPRDPRVVVSKASTSKKYHHTWCSGAKQIAVVNQMWFATASAAEKAGYTLAGNCQ